MPSARNDILNFFKQYNIDSSRCSIFANIILDMALENKPENTAYEWQNNETDLIYKLSITEEDSLQLLAFYNQLNPGFAMLELTPTADDLMDTSSTTPPATADETRRIKISLNAELVAEELIPRLSAYLNAHPKYVSDYRHQQRYTFQEALVQRNNIFHPYGLNLEKTDSFEEALCALTQHHINTAKHVFSFFSKNTYLPKDITLISLSYSGIHPNDRPNAKAKPDNKDDKARTHSEHQEQPQKKRKLSNGECYSLQPEDLPQEEPDIEIVPTVSRTYDDKTDDPYSTYISINVTKEQATHLVHYFNKFGKSMASIFTTSTKSQVDAGRIYTTGNHISECILMTIRVKNAVFFHPTFINNIEDTLRLLPRKTLEDYHKASSTGLTSDDIIANISNDIGTLQQQEPLKPLAETAKLIASLAALRDYLATTKTFYLSNEQLQTALQCIRQAKSNMYLLKSALVLVDALKHFDSHEKVLDARFTEVQTFIDWYLQNLDKYQTLDVAPMVDVATSSAVNASPTFSM